MIAHLLKVCGYTSIYILSFYKGDNFCGFLFSSLEGEALLKWGLLIKERICSSRSKFFPLRVDPN